MPCTRLPLGKIVVPPALSQHCNATGKALFKFLARHQAADWGEADDHDTVLGLGHLNAIFARGAGFLAVVGAVRRAAGLD